MAEIKADYIHAFWSNDRARTVMKTIIDGHNDLQSNFEELCRITDELLIKVTVLEEELKELQSLPKPADLVGEYDI